MLPKTATTLTAAVTAFAIAAGAAAPAQAMGKNERNFLKGVAAAYVVHEMLRYSKRSQPATVTRTQPVYTQPVYTQPTYRAPVQTYNPIYDTSAARAFKAYSLDDRRAIQARLRAWGYYDGAIDGVFGPRTYNAITAYAGSRNGTRELDTMGGAFDFYDTLLG